MPSEGIRQKVELATVKIPRFGGQGILIPGELIVTAAHCIDKTVSRNSHTGMLLGVIRRPRPIKTEYQVKIFRMKWKE